MDLADYDYDLPVELIAQAPSVRRTAARLIVPCDNTFRHLTCADIPTLLQLNDVLITNNTKVVNARLYGHKESGGKVELLLERLLDAQRGLFQARMSKPLQPNGAIRLAGGERLVCEGRQGQFYVLTCAMPLQAILDQYGEVPLPPYIERRAGPVAADTEHYQTVFARVPGAVAAPTAGCILTHRYSKHVPMAAWCVRKLRCM